MRPLLDGMSVLVPTQTQGGGQMLGYNPASGALCTRSPDPLVSSAGTRRLPAAHLNILHILLFGGLSSWGTGSAAATERLTQDRGGMFTSCLRVWGPVGAEVRFSL